MAAPIYGGDEVNAVVLDMGAYQCKAGYAGEDTPRVVFGTAVGEIPEDKRTSSAPMDVDPPSTSANAGGDGAAERKPWQKRGLRALNHPHVKPPDHMEALPTIKDGMVTDWDLWDTVVNEALIGKMRCKAEEHPLVYAEPPFYSKDAREHVVERLFESFGSPAIFLAKNPVLASFALGRQTSLVVDIGFDGTIVSAVNEGYSISSSVMRSPIGGRLLNDALDHSLASKGTHIAPWYTYRHGDGGANGRAGATASHTAWAASALLADIKECGCRVSETPFQEDENQNMPPQSYELPDGSVVAIGVERFKIPEIMFNPGLVKNIPGMRPVATPAGDVVKGLPELVIDSVHQTDIDAHKDLYNGVVLAGGGCLFPSTKERLERELLDLAPQAAKVKVTMNHNTTERKFAVWLGGSILGCLGSFHQLWLSKHEYAEHGAALIHRKSP
eukprot:jgi/Ulvmu1/6442/UM003_0072.1